MSSLPSFMNWGFKHLKEEDSKNPFVLGGGNLFFPSNPTSYYDLDFLEWLAPNNCKILNSNGDFEWNEESSCSFRIEIYIEWRESERFGLANNLLILQSDLEDMIRYYHEIPSSDASLYSLYDQEGDDYDIEGFCGDLSIAFNNIYDRGAFSNPDKHDKNIVDAFFQKIDKVKSYNAGEWRW